MLRAIPLIATFLRCGKKKTTKPLHGKAQDDSFIACPCAISARTASDPCSAVVLGGNTRNHAIHAHCLPMVGRG